MVQMIFMNAAMSANLQGWSERVDTMVVSVLDVVDTLPLHATHRRAAV